MSSVVNYPDGGLTPCGAAFYGPPRTIPGSAMMAQYPAGTLRSRERVRTIQPVYNVYRRYAHIDVYVK